MMNTTGTEYTSRLAVGFYGGGDALQTAAMVYRQERTPNQAPFYGLDYQGRHDDRPWRQDASAAVVQSKIDDGAHAASEHSHLDAEDQMMPEGGALALLWAAAVCGGAVWAFVAIVRWLVSTGGAQ